MTAPTRITWRDVRERFHAAIMSGRYGPGDRLPRDADIADELNCARATVQRAMQDLSDAGLIERRRKGGTRVCAEPVTRATFDIPITRREVEQKGGVYGYRLIGQRRRMPPHHVLKALELSEPQQMLRIEALHLFDGRPYILEDRWVSLLTVPEIADVDLGRTSANEWLVQNRVYSRGSLRFFALAADEAIAGHLEIMAGAALLVFERVTFIDQSPITMVQAITAPGYRLRTEL